MVTTLSFCVAGCGVSAMLSSLLEQPVMMAPTTVRAAIVRNLNLFFIVIILLLIAN